VIPVSLTDVSSYLPGRRVDADHFAALAGTDELADNVMFCAPRHRHHVADETAEDMVERAAAGLVERHGARAVSGVDVLITHTQLPDLPVVGCGGTVARRLGARPEWVIDLHNGGCASFVLMLKLAADILRGRGRGSALVCNVQNTAGRVFAQSEVRTLAQAAIPGDGCGVALLTVSDASPILDVECRHHPEFAGDMTVVTGDGRRYWAPGTGQLRVGFTESGIAEVLTRGNRLVPEAAAAVCDRIGVDTADIDLLVTNQPNRVFLRTWRDALRLPAERHPDTFDDCGNLFGAAMPLTLDRELRAGRVPDGSLVVFAGFAHAGDFSAAAAVSWRP